jgi:hypothetical protein
MDYATLEISDGVTTINLINERPGIHLVSWNQAIALAKGGGTFQSSSLAPNRILVNRSFNNAIETFTLHIDRHSQDAVSREVQELLRLLEKAVEYWTTDWQTGPVWLKVQANCETNPRFALIHYYEIPELTNPFAQPFFGPTDSSIFNNIILAIERGHWLSDQPGTGTAIAPSWTVEWEYKNKYELSSGLAAAAILDFTEDNSGNVYAAAIGQILKWNGAAWAVDSSTPTACHVIITTSNGTLIAGDTGQILRNTGSGWVVPTAAPVDLIRSIVQLSTGRIIAAEDTTEDLWYSDDDGASWSSFNPPPTPSGDGWDNIDAVSGMFVTLSGTILAKASYPGRSAIIRSADNGLTWDLIIETKFGGVSSQDRFVQLSDGTILTADENSGGTTFYIIGSTDDGLTWSTISTTSAISTIAPIALTSDGTLYFGEILGANASLFKSEDNGIFWENVNTFTGIAEVDAIFEASDGTLWIGLSSSDIYSDVDNTIEVDNIAGNATTFYIANKQNVANLTHVKISDGGVFTDIFPISSFPQDLLPTIPAVNDAIYFGIDTSLDDTGPFCSLVFDIGTAQVDLTDVDWEYWNGAWVALTVADNTNNGSSVTPGIGGVAFDTTGINSVHWLQPSDWATTAIDGVTGYWVRARVNTIGTNPAPPTQQNQDIYSITWPYAEIQGTQVGGDISALLEAKVRNRSDIIAGGPDLPSDRLIVGLRSLSRGSGFIAYLNISDEQNPSYVSVTLNTTDTNFANDITAPTGRRATYAPGANRTLDTEVTVSIDASFASHFHGIFHAYLRCEQNGGSAGDVGARLIINDMVGNTAFTNFGGANWRELLDLGRFRIPAYEIPSGEFPALNITLTLELSNSNAPTADLYLYDLILVPVDEWSIDTYENFNSGDTSVSQITNINHYDIDSITFPRQAIRSVRKALPNNGVTDAYIAVTSGEAILQANSNQRLWFLASRVHNFTLPRQAEHEIAHSVELVTSQRYLGMRGDR